MDAGVMLEQLITQPRPGIDHMCLQTPPHGAQVMRQHSDLVCSLAPTPDGASLVVGYKDGCLRCWNLSDGPSFEATVTWTHSKQVCPVEQLVVRPDGGQVASAGRDGAVVVTDLRRGMVVAHLTAHHDFVTGLLYSPRSDLLVSASRVGEVLVWDGEWAWFGRAAVKHQWALGLRRDHEMRIAVAPCSQIVRSGAAATPRGAGFTGGRLSGHQLQSVAAGGGHSRRHGARLGATHNPLPGGQPRSIRAAVRRQGHGPARHAADVQLGRVCAGGGRGGWRRDANGPVERHAVRLCAGYGVVRKHKWVGSLGRLGLGAGICNVKHCSLTCRTTCLAPRSAAHYTGNASSVSDIAFMKKPEHVLLSVCGRQAITWDCSKSAEEHVTDFIADGSRIFSGDFIRNTPNRSCVAHDAVVLHDPLNHAAM